MAAAMFRILGLLIFCMAALLSITQVAAAGRPVKMAAAAAAEDNKMPERSGDGVGVSLGGFGFSIPSFNAGRGIPSIGSSIPAIGSTIPAIVSTIPSTGGLDKSVPAAMNGRYFPGFDDTFVPNPGMEIPIPANGVAP